jgi:hypothetical protein
MLRNINKSASKHIIRGGKLMDILKLLTEQIGDKETLEKLGGSIGGRTEDVEKVAKMGIPALLQALEKNAKSKEGAESLAKALEQHKDDEVEDVKGFLSNVDTDEGDKILQHILGGKKQTLQNNLAKQTGINSSEVSQILTKIAPLLLGALGKEKNQRGVDSSGIDGMLQGLIEQGSQSGLMNIAANLLDDESTGGIIKKLGGLFGKK